MDVVINWLPLYERGNPLPDLPATQRVIEIMLMTARVHHRDFPPHMVQAVYDKVYDGTWMRIRVGTDRDTGQEVVIIYHKLKHMEPENRWSISIGVHPFITPFDRIGETDLRDETEPYVQLATAINDRLFDDAQTNRLGADAGLVIYDDVHRGTPGGISNNPNVRRTTAIGELGWVAQNRPEIMDLWPTKVGPTKMRRPRRKGHPSSAPPIPGWGRDGRTPDVDVVKTLLVPR